MNTPTTQCDGTRLHNCIQFRPICVAPNCNLYWSSGIKGETRICDSIQWMDTGWTVKDEEVSSVQIITPNIEDTRIY